MARQTVRRPPAQHTGRTEWPDKLSDTLQHSTWAGLNGQTNCQTPSCTAHRPDRMARQTVRRPPAQWAGLNGQTNCQMNPAQHMGQM
eukprot:525640-Rhodomonas_salina.1